PVGAREALDHDPLGLARRRAGSGTGLRALGGQRGGDGEHRHRNDGAERHESGTWCAFGSVHHDEEDGPRGPG
ncbi:MAG: hypothetical protein ACOCUS_02125, partial [Polyangiales bacterium]